MSLYTVTFDQTAQPEDLNQIVNVLEQPPGGVESGGWYLNGNGAASSYIGTWIATLSRYSTPVHASVSVSIGPAGSLGSPIVGNTTKNGFNVYAQFSAASLNGYEGGTYTVQF